ncbi:MAG: adenylate/guanylate cyclase domain-containing protein [Anaerolineales bacterium]
MVDFSSSINWESPENAYAQLGAMKMTSAERRHLYKALRPYLSPLLIEEYLQPTTAPPPRYQFYEGSILFVDISGFSALTEALSVDGKVGAEQLTEIINRYFTELLNVAFLYDGVQIKFAGDAVLLYYGGNYHAERAAECALHMQSKMQDSETVHTTRGDFPLYAHIGINSGKVFSASIGSNERREYIFSGPPIRSVLRAADLAGAGQIVAAGELVALLPNAKTTPVANADGFHLLKSVNRMRPKETLGATASFSRQPRSSELADLASYLPFPLVQRILAFQDDVSFIAEHRLVTILFIRFDGLDDLLASGSPEQLLQELQDYFLMVENTVKYYGGVISRCDPAEFGDKLLILFGAPVSHENDAEYAVQCALDLNSNLARLNSHIHHRVGVATGHAFCGDVGSRWHKEYTVMGNAANLAARLMNKAGDHQIFANALTLEGSADQVVAEALAPIKVKGFLEPVQVHRLIRWNTQSRVAVEDKPLNGLVGRQGEISFVRRICLKALSGQGQGLSITGPSGIGKSFLTAVAVDTWQEAGGRVCGGACQAYGERIPYLPWVAILEDFFGLEAADGPDTRRQKVAECVSELVPAWKDRLYVPGNILGLAIPAAVEIDPNLYQQQLYSFTLNLLTAFARKTPFLLTVSDLHWCDQASLDLIRHIMRNIQGERMLVCVNYRVGEGVQRFESLGAGMMEVNLKGLSQTACRDFISSLLDGKAASAPLFEQLWQASRGNPLFLQEIIRYLQDQGDIYFDTAADSYVRRDDLAAVPIPGSLEKVIISNLDRLDEKSRQVLKIASVIGRDFPVDVFKPFYPSDHLQDVWQGLVKRGFLLAEPSHGRDGYAFCRTQAQEIIYASQAFSQRKKIHRQVGNAFESQMAQDLPKIYSLLAYHFDLGEDWPKAFSYHLQAGGGARRTYANHEAMYHYRRSLELAPVLAVPPDAEALWNLHKEYGRVCRFLGLYPEAQQSYSQGLGLAREAGSLVGEAEILVWVSDLCQLKGDGQGLEQNARQAVSIAERVNDPALLELGLEYLGGSGLFQADFDAALQSFERCLALSRSANLPEGVLRSLNNISLIYINRMHYGSAIAALTEALAFARELRDFFYTAILANNLGELYQELYDAQAALPLHEEALAIARQYDVKDLHCDSLRNLSVDLALTGNLDQGIVSLRQAFALARDVGFRVSEAVILYNLGDLLLKTGAVQEAHDRLEDLIELSMQLNIPFLLQKANYLKSQICREKGQYDDALDAIQKVIQSGPTGQLGWQAYFTLADVSECLGDLNAARVARAEARRLVLMILDTITDDNLRAIFVRNSTVNSLLSHFAPYGEPG